MHQTECCSHTNLFFPHATKVNEKSKLSIAVNVQPKLLLISMAAAAPDKIEVPMCCFQTAGKVKRIDA